MASVNTDPAWRETGWTSWRLDSASAGKFEDEYVKKMRKAEEERLKKQT